MGGYAWVTLATNDAYSLGALVLAHSLRRVGTKHELAVLITPGVTQTMREKLSAVFSAVMEVNVLDSKDEANLALLARPELGVTFTKLHCWRLTQYEKCVFLDADTLVVRNCDELFEREELSAAPDVGWPDCFNSGVFVYKPSQQTFASITAFAAAKGSFDGGDQGLLNMYFSDWARKDISKHLPFIYNMCSTAAYSYLPAFKQFGDDVRIIHFIGITKPWLQYFDTLTGIVQPPMESAHLQPLLQLWWNIFCEKVHPQLSPVMATSTLAPIWHKFSPMPFQSYVPKPFIYADIQDKTQNDIFLEPPDFSEFQDPWDNYSMQNDPTMYKTENNEIQQYYPTVISSPPMSNLSEQFDCPKSIHQTHYESLPECNRDFCHRQQYSEYNSTSYNQRQNQDKSNQFINQNKQQHSHFETKDTSILEVQPNLWPNEHRKENCISVHSIETYHFNESQHRHIDNQHIPHIACCDNSRLGSEETKQREQVDHEQHNHNHFFSHNNELQSVEMRQNQHNEHYVSYECNHYQVHNNVNNEQIPQNYEEKSPLLHSNLQTDFRCEEQKSSSVKIDHDQDKRTNTQVSNNSPPDSKPCTDFHNVAPQSDPQIGDDLNISNAGLAGALAQMTLGEPRSAEQIALEEHMRKQSWEQGHIDYMGRDSFDNIWKKICQTLALAPPRLPSPPKELQASEETDTFKTEKPLTPSIAAQSVESVDEVDKETAQTTTSHTEEQSLVNNVPITNVPKLLEKNAEVIQITSPVKESTGTAQEPFADTRKDTLDPSINPLSMNTLTSLEDVPKLSSSSILEEIPQQIALPRASSNLVQPLSVVKQKTVTSAEKVKTEKKNIETPEVIVDIKETMQPDIQDEKHAKELLTASEILTVNPVPIQVAESVLQLEPKESVLDAQISQEIISSTVTPVHLTEAKKKIHMNGSTSTSTDAVGKLNKLTTQPVESSQTSLPTDQTQPQLTLVLDTSVPESKETETCLRENLQSKTQATLKCENTKSTPSSIEAPTRPSRAKESVTSSPSVAKTAQQEKTVKRTVKKVVEKPEGEPSETTDGDSSGKKETKKVVKKVTKKPKTKSDEGLDDGAEDNSLVSKQKKTVKVVKKGTKSSQTTATDTAASEIPSASTSDAPIPPKRKTKPTVAKTVTKKSDIAQ